MTWPERQDLRKRILDFATSGKLPLVHGFSTHAAKVLNCKTHMVRLALKEAGITLLPKPWSPRPETEARISQVKVLRAQGLTYEAIAAILGTSRQRVDQLLHSEKEATRCEFKKALSRGDILKPRHCDACGKKKRDLEAHHDDYSKPLAVRWLCVRCHNDIPKPHVRLEMYASEIAATNQAA